MSKRRYSVLVKLPEYQEKVRQAIALGVEKQLAEEAKVGRPSKLDAIGSPDSNKGEIPTKLSAFSGESASH